MLSRGSHPDSASRLPPAASAPRRLDRREQPLGGLPPGMLREEHFGKTLHRPPGQRLRSLEIASLA